MREMVNSEIDWLGDMPSHWKVHRNKALFKNVSIKNHGDATVLSLYRELGVIPKDSRDDNHNVTSLDTDSYKYVEQGDLVINKMKAWSGSLGVSDYEGIVSPAYYVCKVDYSKVTPRFIHHYMRNLGIVEAYEMYSAGMRIGQWDLGIDDFMSIKVGLPPYQEQDKIAERIDKDMAKVDALIANQQAQIEKLKQYKQSLITEIVTKGLDPNAPMKDSGVEWIGLIPATWSISRVKYICNFNSSVKTDLSPDDIVAYAPMECVKNGYMVPREITVSSVSSGLTLFQEGDIVMAKVTPCFENGNIAIATNIKNGVGFGSSELFTFRDYKVNAKWLMYFLLNRKFVQLACSTMTGTGGLKRVSPVFVNALSIAIPPDGEQREVVEFLDEKLMKVDKLIGIKEKKIEKLTDYKKSLIYEYVTGKKEVS